MLNHILTLPEHVLHGQNLLKSLENEEPARKAERNVLYFLFDVMKVNAAATLFAGTYLQGLR